MKKGNSLNKEQITFQIMWSRRGLNPRPNDEFSSFLHAYSSIIFRW